MGAPIAISEATQLSRGSIPREQHLNRNPYPTLTARYESLQQA